MLKWVYFINALISFLCLVYYFETTLNKVNQKQLLILVTTTFSNWAYCFAASARSLEGYYTAYVFYYIGITFSVFLMVFIIREILGFTDSKLLRRGYLIYGLAIIYFIITIKFNKLYYVSYKLAEANGVSYLIKQYGPFHKMLLVYIVGSNLLCITMTIYAYIKKKASSRKTTIALLIIYTITSMTYFVPRMFHMPFESMPFSFTLIDILFILIFKKASMYDMSANLMRVYEQRSEYGYFALDKNYRFVGASELAAKLFPELAEIRIDSRIEFSDGDLSTTILPWVYEWRANRTKTFVYTKDDTTVTCSIREINSGSRCIGYLIEMKDVSKQQKYIDLINTYNTQLETKVLEKTFQIQQAQDSIISGMASMVESRDNSTGGHIRRTSEGVKIFIEELMKPEYSMNFSDSFCRKIIKAAPMHDLGKIAVDDVILRKPGKFEPEEYEQMKKHSAEGARIVSQVLFNVDDDEFRDIAINVAHFHHEKWNGQGYPEGLKEEEIPIEARIMAYADVFDALVSKRCYKDSFSFDKAFEIIQNDLGKHFDPNLGAAFLNCRPKLEEYYKKLDE